jgi:hypothetical protein
MPKKDHFENYRDNPIASESNPASLDNLEYGNKPKSESNLQDLESQRPEGATKPEKKFFGNMKDKLIGGAKKTWEKLKSLKNTEQNKNIDKVEAITPEAEIVSGLESEELANSEAGEQLSSELVKTRSELKKMGLSEKMLNGVKNIKEFRKDFNSYFNSLSPSDKAILCGGLVALGGLTAVGLSGVLAAAGTGFGSFNATLAGTYLINGAAINSAHAVFLAEIQAGVVGSAASMLSAERAINFVKRIKNSKNRTALVNSEVITHEPFENINKRPKTSEFSASHKMYDLMEKGFQGQTSNNKTNSAENNNDPIPVNYEPINSSSVNDQFNSQPRFQTEITPSPEIILQEIVPAPLIQPQEKINAEATAADIANKVVERVFSTNTILKLDDYVTQLCQKLELKELEKLGAIPVEKANEIRAKYLDARNKILDDEGFQQRAKEHAEKLKAQKEAESQVNVEQETKIQETTKPKLEVSTEMRNLLDGLKASVQVTEAAPQHFNTQEQRTRRHLNLREKLSHLSGKPRLERKKHHQTALENLKSAPKVENLTERFPIPPTPEELALKWQRQAEELKSEPEVVVQERSDPYKAPEFFDNALAQQVEVTQIAENNDSPELTSLKSELAGLEAEFSATDGAWANRGTLEHEDQVSLGRKRNNIQNKIYTLEKQIRKNVDAEKKQKLIEESSFSVGESLDGLAMVRELERMKEEVENLAANSPEENRLNLEIKELNTKIYETGIEGLLSNKAIYQIRTKVFGRLRTSMGNGDFTGIEKFVKNPLEYNNENNRTFAIKFFEQGVSSFNEQITTYTREIESSESTLKYSLEKPDALGAIPKDRIPEFKNHIEYDKKRKIEAENDLAIYLKALEIINSL